MNYFVKCLGASSISPDLDSDETGSSTAALSRLQRPNQEAVLTTLADRRQSSPPRSAAGAKRPGSPLGPQDELTAKKLVKKSDGENHENSSGKSNATAVSLSQKRIKLFAEVLVGLVILLLDII